MKYRHEGDTIIATDEGGDWIIGKLIREGGEVWVGCIECEQEITSADAGMCQECRSDLAYAEAQQ